MDRAAEGDQGESRRRGLGGYVRDKMESDMDSGRGRGRGKGRGGRDYLSWASLEGKNPGQRTSLALKSGQWNGSGHGAAGALMRMRATGLGAVFLRLGTTNLLGWYSSSK
jgi:hypothetical protein